jgi:hypothetical protein
MTLEYKGRFMSFYSKLDYVSTIISWMDALAMQYKTTSTFIYDEQHGLKTVPEGAHATRAMSSNLFSKASHI